jgi:hypothetical protein
MEECVQARRKFKQANPLKRVSEVLRGAKFSSEVTDSKLPRKASSEEASARTANRHR